MHPAVSVILLTTLIGAGQGLLLALFTVQSYTLVGLLPAAEGPVFYVTGSVIALALLVAGLVASFFHLSRPERAWRSAAQWRTSWLSREVIVLPAFMAAVALYGLLHAVGGGPVLLQASAGLAIDASLAVGAVASVLAFALFVCTGMIYACIRFLQEWASPLTVANFVLLGCACGLTLASAYAAFAAVPLVGAYVAAAMVFTLLGLATRTASLRRNARLKPKSTLQSATGIHHPRIVQKSQGFTGSSYNTREFFHRRGAALVRQVKWAFLLLAFAVPLVLLAWGLRSGSGALLGAAFVVQYVGLIAERWFFFAQANHPQNLYYQAVS